MRVCRKCGVELVEEDNWYLSFVRARQYICKSCSKLKARENARKWRAANPEEAREKVRKWKAANPEKVRENARKWRAANPEKVREKARKWKAANPEKVREKARRWYVNARIKKIESYITYRKTRDIFHLFEFLQEVSV